MKKLFSLTALGALLYAMPANANVVFPRMFIAEAVYSAWFLIFITIIIEGLLIKLFIREISYTRALIMSSVGNAVSTFVGTAITTLIALIVDVHPLLIETTRRNFQYDVVSTVILMCLGSALIELITLAVAFRYRIKELLWPVLIGNIATYGLTWLYYYLYLPEQLNAVFAFW